MQLAPGGHVGRFCIWTQPAVEKLDALFGTYAKAAELKKDYLLPRSIVTNPDLPRIINSDEIQSVLKAAGPKSTKRPFTLRKNPLRNMGVMVRLNPYAQTLRRRELVQKKTTKVSKVAKKNPAFVKALLSEQ